MDIERFRGIIARLLLAFVPMGLTPLFGWLIAENHVGFGGGEKDMVILIPWLVWSLIYMIVFIVMWSRKVTALKCVLRSAAIATAALFAIWVVLYTYSAGLLGIKIN